MFLMLLADSLACVLHGGLDGVAEPKDRRR
jgi:hypothetical protein